MSAKPVNIAYMVAAAKRKGVLIPQPCRDCGATEKIQAHHHDYRKPLDVIWLCRPCHMKEHSRLRKSGKKIPRHRNARVPKTFVFDRDVVGMLRDLAEDTHRNETNMVMWVIEQAWKARFPEGKRQK